MSLSSRPPVAARNSSSNGALSDAMSMFNPQELGNDLISNSISAALFQMTGLDQFFAPQGGDNYLYTVAKEGAYTTAVNHVGMGMRMAVPQLRVFG